MGNKEIIGDTLTLIENAKSLYTNYLEATMAQLSEIEEQKEHNEETAGKILNLVASQHYYVGQLDALENIRNYINLLLMPEPKRAELEYAERIN